MSRRSELSLKYFSLFLCKLNEIEISKNPLQKKEKKIWRELNLADPVFPKNRQEFNMGDAQIS